MGSSCMCMSQTLASTCESLIEEEVAVVEYLRGVLQADPFPPGEDLKNARVRTCMAQKFCKKKKPKKKKKRKPRYGIEGIDAPRKGDTIMRMGKDL